MTLSGPPDAQGRPIRLDAPKFPPQQKSTSTKQKCHANQIKWLEGVNYALLFPSLRFFFFLVGRPKGL